MLLRREGDSVLAIGQTSHAWISGQLARAWGNEQFPTPEPHEEVCLAAEQHDVGWAVWDLDPKRNAETGLPYSFMELPLEEHLALWSAAGGRLLTQSSYAALLVSMHGSRLYRRRNLDQFEAVREYLEQQDVFQQPLRAGCDLELLARNSQLIWTWDFLSLAMCLDWSPRTATDVPTADGSIDIEIAHGGERRFSLRPWPFELDAVTVRCEARRLAARYETDEALGDGLASASWETLELELVATSA